MYTYTHTHTHTYLLLLLFLWRNLTDTELSICFSGWGFISVDTDATLRSFGFKTKKVVHVTGIMMFNTFFLFSSKWNSNGKIHFHMIKNPKQWILFLIPFSLSIKKLLRKAFYKGLIIYTTYTSICICKLTKNKKQTFTNTLQCFMIYINKFLHYVKYVKSLCYRAINFIYF